MIQTLPRDLYSLYNIGSFFQLELEKLHKDDLTSLKKEKSSEEDAADAVKNSNVQHLRWISWTIVRFP